MPTQPSSTPHTLPEELARRFRWCARSQRALRSCQCPWSRTGQTKASCESWHCRHVATDVIPAATVPLGSRRLTQKSEISGLLTALSVFPRRLKKSLLLHIT